MACNKITNANQSWPNVNEAIKSFKTEDKTLTKIIKFIPNVIKLIGAFCLDISNKVLIFFGKKPFAIGSQKDSKDNSKPGTFGKVKNFMLNHKGIIILHMGAVAGMIFLGKRLYDQRQATMKLADCFGIEQDYRKKSNELLGVCLTEGTGRDTQDKFYHRRRVLLNTKPRYECIDLAEKYSS